MNFPHLCLCMLNMYCVQLCAVRYGSMVCPFNGLNVESMSAYMSFRFGPAATHRIDFSSLTSKHTPNHIQKYFTPSAFLHTSYTLCRVCSIAAYTVRYLVVVFFFCFVFYIRLALQQLFLARGLHLARCIVANFVCVCEIIAPKEHTEKMRVRNQSIFFSARI